MLTSLQVNNFRNLTDVKLECTPTCNLFYGANGSGKTSLLEAIYYLGLGRSFRTHLLSRVIKHNSDQFTLFGVAHPGVGIGVERARNGRVKMRIAGQDVTSRAECAQLLPLLLFNQNSFELLTAGPHYKRKFIDWGLFHVEPTFLQLWKNANRALLQRNAALKSCGLGANISRHAGVLWNKELARESEAMHQMRQTYVAELLPWVQQLVARVLGDVTVGEVSFKYYPGWDLDRNLESLLADNLDRDCKMGFTQYGHHRADLKICFNGVPAQDVLSRGQQKLLVFALGVAQGLLLREHTGKNCVYLIDDLPAELDPKKRTLIAEVLRDLAGAQIFVTGLERSVLSELSAHPESRMFHVEHGKIFQENS